MRQQSCKKIARRYWKAVTVILDANQGFVPRRRGIVATRKAKKLEAQYRKCPCRIVSRSKRDGSCNASLYL